MTWIVEEWWNVPAGEDSTEAMLQAQAQFQERFPDASVEVKLSGRQVRVVVTPRKARPWKDLTPNAISLKAATKEKTPHEKAMSAATMFVLAWGIGSLLMVAALAWLVRVL